MICSAPPSRPSVASRSRWSLPPLLVPQTLHDQLEVGGLEWSMSSSPTGPSVPRAAAHLPEHLLDELVLDREPSGPDRTHR